MQEYRITRNWQNNLHQHGNDTPHMRTYDMIPADTLHTTDVTRLDKDSMEERLFDIRWRVHNLRKWYPNFEQNGEKSVAKDLKTCNTQRAFLREITSMRERAGFGKRSA